MKCLSPFFTSLGPVPCGRCINCQINRSQQWSIRCLDEFKITGIGFFLTLTFKKTDGKLRRKPLQDFLKRLRKEISPVKIRYFGCGEYGSKGLRPHYHLLVFGWRPDDLVSFRVDRKGQILYRSALIERIWHSHTDNSYVAGFISIGDINEVTCRYASKYCSKLGSFDSEYPPFSAMSTHPGIGASSVSLARCWQGTIVYQNKVVPAPRYYITCLSRQGVSVDGILADRRSRSCLLNGDYPVLDYNEIERACFEARQRLERKIPKNG
ncbi:replication initiator protein [Capybara microvirus Cap1_SP_223]|nr:replication initiator protein [Capybara microvirus Cap1_SP_223]